MIELLVVVEIIGILAIVGVVAYNGYTLGTKRNAALANFTTASKLVRNSLKLCEFQNSVQLSPTRIVDFKVANISAGVGKVANVFMNYFLDQGFKNSYNNNGSVIIFTGSGGDKIDGRMRFDYESCSVETKLNLWVKTHKDHLKESFMKDGWCKQ